MARSKYTTGVLSLDRFAEIMGLNPAGFSGVYGNPVCYTICGTCEETWAQSSWQKPGSYLSRDELAQLIRDAERDVSKFLKIPLRAERRCVVLPYRRDCLVGEVYDYTWRANARPSYDVGACPAWVLPPLAEDILCSPCIGDGIEILDQNGEEYVNDSAHCPVEVRISCEVLGDIRGCEIHLYPEGHVGDPSWEIRPFDIVDLTYDSGDSMTSIVISLKPWQMVRYELVSAVQIHSLDYDNQPDNSVSLLDMGNYYDCLVLVRNCHDDSQPTAEFIWEPKGTCGCGQDDCDICTVKTCPACVVQYTRDDPGRVLLSPAVWDADKEKWCASKECWSNYGEPDSVRIWYWTGYHNDNGCQVNSICEIDYSELERLIAILVAARLPKNVCVCTCNETTRWAEWQRYANYSSTAQGAFFVSVEQADNPFGTRIGELEVYRSLKLIKSRLCGGNVTSTGV